MSASEQSPTANSVAPALWIRTESTSRQRFLLGLSLALLVFAAALVAFDARQGLSGLVIASHYGIGLALGSSIFIAIQGVSNARWWTSLHNLASAISATLPIPATLLALTLATGAGSLYPWARSAPHTAHAIWLNVPLLLARTFTVLLVWMVLSAILRDRLRDWATRASDHAALSGSLHRRFVRASIWFLLALAPTLSIAAWDLTMSLESPWYSTMYSVYLFGGWFLGGIALLAALAGSERASNAHRPTAALSHDLGKLLFAFSTFWAYLWFCQYLLIWYANLPEETSHYAIRLSGGWSTLFWLNPLLNFGVPFTVLLSAKTKKQPAALRQVAIVVLFGRWLDTYLLIAPTVAPAPVFPAAAIVATLAVVLAMTSRTFPRAT